VGARLGRFYPAALTGRMLPSSSTEEGQGGGVAAEPTQKPRSAPAYVIGGLASYWLIERAFAAA
ncbi:MAG TPA: hypothetical protein VF213_14075, partial [Dongiaceae bacterium]